MNDFTLLLLRLLSLPLKGQILCYHLETYSQGTSFQKISHHSKPVLCLGPYLLGSRSLSPFMYVYHSS